MKTKLLLVVASVAMVATKYAELIRQEKIQTKALCPPGGLQGLVGSLQSSFVDADAVLFTTDAFVNSGNATPLSVVKALHETKPNLRILVLRVGGMAEQNYKALLQAGASGVYTGMGMNPPDLLQWATKNVLGETSPDIYKEKRSGGRVRAFSMPKFSSDGSEREEGDDEEFPLEDLNIVNEDIPPSALLKKRPILPIKKAPAPAVTSKPLVSKEVKAAPESVSTVCWPYPTGKASKQAIDEPEEKQVAAKAAVARPHLVTETKPPHTEEDLQKTVESYEGIILGLMKLADEVETFSRSFKKRLAECIAPLAKFSESGETAAAQTSDVALDHEQVAWQKENSVVITEVSACRSRVQFIGYNFELTNRFAELFVFIVQAKGATVTREAIMKQYDMTNLTAYQQVRKLVLLLGKLAPGLDECIANDRGNGWYFKPVLRK